MVGLHTEGRRALETLFCLKRLACWLGSNTMSFQIAEHRDAFDGLCIPWIGGGYGVGAGRRRAGCSVLTAERVANAIAIVAFDRRKAFSPAGTDRTSTADAKRSASRCSGAIRQAIDPDDRSTPKHLSRLLSGVKGTRVAALRLRYERMRLGYQPQDRARARVTVPPSLLATATRCCSRCGIPLQHETHFLRVPLRPL
jgi:hypothetical protein